MKRRFLLNVVGLFLVLLVVYVGGFPFAEVYLTRQLDQASKGDAAERTRAEKRITSLYVMADPLLRTVLVTGMQPLYFRYCDWAHKMAGWG